MELKITDLLDCIEDESVKIRLEGTASAERIKELAMKKIEKRAVPLKRIFLISLAAALVLAFGITAYASDFFGARALARPELTEGAAAPYEGVSITQPQAVPEALPPEIAERVAASKAAWEEWTQRKAEYRKIKGWDKPPAVFEPPQEPRIGRIDTEKNKDGSYTISFYTFGDSPEELILAESRIATAEELAAHEGYLNACNSSYGSYDFSYNVCNAEEEALLEDIAEKYGMRLRGSQRLAWSSDTAGMTGEGFYTNAELAAMTAQIGCAGSIFYETPVGFDKLYWFGEGTFGVSYYVSLPITGARVLCYGYNSMYSTLSSGNEVLVCEEENILSFDARTHTAPDGTEVTILKGTESAYIYVYLENSFFAEHIKAENLTDAELDYIADCIDYSLIGK